MVSNDYFEFGIGAFFSTIGFVLYYFMNEAVKSGHKLDSTIDIKDNSRKILFQRLFGAFILGVLPASIFLIFSSKPMNEIGLTNLYSFTDFSIYIDLRGHYPPGKLFQCQAPFEPRDLSTDQGQRMACYPCRPE